MKSPEYHGTGRFRAGLFDLGQQEEQANNWFIIVEGKKTKLIFSLFKKFFFLIKVQRLFFKSHHQMNQKSKYQN
jgi:hypothetical protein